MGGRAQGTIRVMKKIALVHDYLKEFGGAERVLRVLADMYPEAPIYTAFCIKESVAGKAFVDRRVIESPWGWLIKRWRLYSPLRFLLPWIWGSMDLSEYDEVITSCSGYIARGFKVSEKTKVVAYCHTPPRFLYGYKTSIDWQKYALVRVYAVVVNHFLRLFDWKSAQRVDSWMVNSKNVEARVKKFYGKEAVVVYPPVEVEKIEKESAGEKKRDYFLIVSRLVGAKGLEEAAEAAKKLGFELRIVGGAAGYSTVEDRLKELGVELLGRVGDEELYKLYAEAKGFIALARDEDFGMTVVEAMAAGTPVIAFDGGGFRETVKDGVSGVLIKDTDEKTIEAAIERFNKLKWNKKEIQKWAEKFSREKFETGVKKVMNSIL